MIARTPTAPTTGSLLRRWPSVLRQLVGSLIIGWPIACAQRTITWAGPPETLAGPVTESSALVVRNGPHGPVVTAQPIPAPGAGLPRLGAGTCIASVRWARDGPSDIAVTWWVARPDSSVALELSRSRDDGAHWDSAGIADARDRGVRGCNRPAPAVAEDAASGYTHLAYFLEPATGAGIFYVHLMELPIRTSAGTIGREAMYHAPVAVVYGGTPREASVAARGDTVVIAYEDPNGPGPTIAAIISVTAGHSFLPSVVASGAGVTAREPLAAVLGGTVAVAWRESAFHIDDTADSGSAPADHAVVRLGQFR